MTEPTMTSSHHRHWLTGAMAGAGAILAFRLGAGGVAMLLALPTTSRTDLLREIWMWRWPIQLAVGAALGVLVAGLLYKLVGRSSLAARFAVFAVLLVLAVVPLRAMVKVDVQLAGAEPNLLTPADVTPATLECRLIDGTTVDQRVLFTEENVRSARAVTSAVYAHNVQLVLDQEGIGSVIVATSLPGGKRLGFWVDGELVAVARVTAAPTRVDDVVIPLNCGKKEAARLAARLTK